MVLGNTDLIQSCVILGTSVFKSSVNDVYMHTSRLVLKG